jgi:hypothetical protein
MKIRQIFFYISFWGSPSQGKLRIRIRIRIGIKIRIRIKIRIKIRIRIRIFIFPLPLYNDINMHVCDYNSSSLSLEKYLFKNLNLLNSPTHRLEPSAGRKGGSKRGSK